MRALEYGLSKIKDSGIDFDLIKDMHRILLTGVRGDEKSPGRFRQSQNWIGKLGTDIGDSTFIPPDPDALIKPLHEFMNYLHSEKPPLLIQASLMHYYFETIHPFRDGNGRVGRLLITLFLCRRKALSEPLLYLSSYFHQNRETYYSLLLNVSQTSEYMPWIRFFLKGVKEQAKDALRRARELVKLREDYRDILTSKNSTSNSFRLLDFLFENPYITIPKLKEKLDVSYPTAQRAVKDLEEFGILEEITGKERNRKYRATKILEILE